MVSENSFTEIASFTFAVQTFPRDAVSVRGGLRGESILTSKFAVKLEKITVIVSKWFIYEDFIVIQPTRTHRSCLDEMFILCVKNCV